MWTNSHLLPTMACVTGPLEGSQATLCSPELLHCGSQEIQERHQHQNQHLQKAFDYKCHNTFGLRSQMAAGHCFSEKERGKTLDQPSWLQTFRNNSGVSGSRRPKCLLFFFFSPGGSLDSYFWSNWIKDDELFRDKQFHTGMKKKEVRSY